MFWYVTLPNIRWALLYGAVLCNARVMGEFGAVSVVAGSIRGQTNTLPLQISQLFNDFNVTGAFAAASTLALMAVVTLILKSVLGRNAGRG
jgi:sulfate transport system permease protein